MGDTVVVRTLSGSVWGDTMELVEELRIGRVEGPPEYTFGRVAGLAVGADGTVYVVDDQVPALRAYGPDGEHLATIGRRGGGPGEYENPDGGVAVLPDGRILLRDTSGRINVYDAGGEYLDAWPTKPNQYTSRPLVVDTAGRTHNMLFEFTEEGTTEWLVRFSPDGIPLDTLDVPTWSFDPPILEAVVVSKGGRSMSRRAVPFSPRPVWAYSPLGYFVGGVPTRYRLELLRRGGRVLRLERDHPTVRVKAEEKSDVRRRVVAGLRRTDPDWTWDGPPIPEVKPPYRDVFVGYDGRIWVLRHMEAERVPEAELDAADARPGGMPPRRWREPVVFDVFEPDGRYLGPVRAPEGFRLRPTPVFRGEHVWAHVTDDLRISYVSRFRLRGSGADAREAP